MMSSLSAGAGISVGRTARAEGGDPVSGKDWSNDTAWVRARYGSWGGPGVSAGPGPMDTVALRDYAPKSSLVIAESFVARARYPAIDFHAHVCAKTPTEVRDWVHTMDEVGIDLTVVLTGATGAEFDNLCDLYLRPYPNRFQLYCGLLTQDIGKPGYPGHAVDELVRCYREGARGVGELSDKGWGLAGDATMARKERLHPDDTRLDPFWGACARLKLPVNLHVADHPSAWKPLDVYQERTPDYQHFNLYGKDVPSYEELLAARDRALQKHSGTTFVACHLGNQGNDFHSLSKVLDAHSNLYVDISARDYEVGRTPRAAAKFLTAYSDRVMFGTDMDRDQDMYRSWWRLLETADEFMPGRIWWRYYGLELPAPVLKSLYRDNATKVMNWEKL